MLFQCAAAPAIAGLFWMDIKDCYEKEPWKMLFLGTLFGLYSAAVVYGLGGWLELHFPHTETPLYTAFLSSAGVEEGVKFLFLLCLIWHNPNFNEPLDGIVYAVFLSLGFAWAENVVYVLHPDLGGYSTALIRAVLSVPGHGLFGVQMGYYLARARFGQGWWNVLAALGAPYFLHGCYNFFLLERSQIFWLPFFALEFLLWRLGLCRIRQMQEISPFR